MNNQPGTVAQNPQVSVGAHASADVGGVIHSFEQSQIILCVTFLILFLASIGLKVLLTSVWTDIGAGIGLLGLLFVLIFWLAKGKPTADQDKPASVSVTDGNKTISARNIDPKEAVFALREVIQNRRILPPPDGEVISIDGENPIQVRSYSDEEKQSFNKRFLSDIREHDANLLAQLEDFFQTGTNHQPNQFNRTESSPIPLATQEERTLEMPTAKDAESLNS